MQSMPRRTVLGAMGLAAATLLGCSAGGPRDEEATLKARPRARVRARPLPRPTGDTPAADGVASLDVPGASRAVLLYVPANLRGGQPRLVVSLHGAGGEAQSSVARFRPWADAHRLLVLAPASQGTTWDVLGGSWGPDVEVIDAALAKVFDAYPIDPGEVSISGFSDGASYALSLGLANGDLFRHIIAFSPGFVAPGPRTGSPDVYVSHGTQDDVLPIDRTSRVIVPDLREAGYQVRLNEFDGPHAVPERIAEDAADWLASGR